MDGWMVKNITETFFTTVQCCCNSVGEKVPSQTSGKKVEVTNMKSFNVKTAVAQ